MSTRNNSDNFVNSNDADVEKEEGSGEQEQLDDTLIKTQDQAIEFSSKLVEALNGKMKDHNAANESSKVSLSQLRQVYCDAVDSYDPEKHLENKNHFGFARVNMFLNITMGKFPQSMPVSGNYLSLSNIDMTFGFNPDSECWASAKEDIQKFNIDYNFDSVDELFIEEPQNLGIIFWD